MIEQGFLSASERIATLRQYFRSRRDVDAVTGTRANSEWEATQWPQTEWSDTLFDVPFAENC